MINTKHPLFLEDMNNIYSSRHEWEELKSSVFFVTGATGMLASYFVYFLIWLNEKKNFGISIIINFRNIEKCKKLYGRYFDCSWFFVVQEDICTIDYNKNPIFLNVDYIIHAASFASAKYFGEYPVETILPNTVGTYNLLNYYKDKRVKGMVFLSSTSVYGNGDLKQALDENQPCIIDLSGEGNYYGISKYCGEALCKAYSKEYGFPVVSVRIAHSYGPTMDITEDVRVFSEFVSNVIDGRNIKIKSDGTTTRLFCYASDCISGILIAMLDGISGESYNLGNPEQQYSIFELAKLIVSLVPQKQLKIVYSKRELENYSPSTYSSNTTIDISKLKSLGWRCRVDAREGFARTVQIIDDQRR